MVPSTPSDVTDSLDIIILITIFGFDRKLSPESRSENCQIKICGCILATIWDYSACYRNAAAIYSWCGLSDSQIELKVYSFNILTPNVPLVKYFGWPCRASATIRNVLERIDIDPISLKSILPIFLMFYSPEQILKDSRWH